MPLENRVLLVAAHGAVSRGGEPALVRAALEAGGDVLAEVQGPDFRSLVHVAAALGHGVQEVGADAPAEAFAAFGMFGMFG
ncbi:hypothetical protein [Streptomyces collinus]|uniref:hypothetical protein n=1 Tax=Streptomyces collinus TaxID=42684 RepID=UPI0036BD5399